MCSTLGYFTKGFHRRGSHLELSRSKGDSALLSLFGCVGQERVFRVAGSQGTADDKRVSDKTSEQISDFRFSSASAHILSYNSMRHERNFAIVFSIGSTM